MKETERVGPRELRRLLFRLLDARPTGSPAVVRAWPLGFPVVEAAYAIQERVPQPTGLVRRAVLEAVCRFGPCSPADIDALLGIGEDLVAAALWELTLGAPDLTVSAGQYSAGPRARALLAAGEFTRVVEHRRKFLINGLTDRLLPVDFWRVHEDCRLFPNPAAPAAPFRTADGRQTEIEGRLSDRAADGLDDLRRVAGGSDRDEKQRLGVPPGTCEIPGAATACRLSWVAAWALLRRDGGAEVVSAGSPPVPLLDGPAANGDYLRRAVQGLRAGAFDLRAGVPGSVARHWPADAVVKTGDDPGEVAVGLPEWNGSPEGEEDVTRRRLEDDLVRGRVWDWHTGSLLTVSPADPRTAAFVAAHRGARELRIEVRLLRPNGPPPWSLADWWAGWLERLAATLPAHARPSALPIASLVEAAERLCDSEFLERVEWLGGL
jgi:hypothetical protein